MLPDAVVVVVVGGSTPPVVVDDDAEVEVEVEGSTPPVVVDVEDDPEVETGGSTPPVVVDVEDDPEVEIGGSPPVDDDDDVLVDDEIGPPPPAPPLPPDKGDPVGELTGENPPVELAVGNADAADVAAPPIPGGAASLNASSGLAGAAGTALGAATNGRIPAVLMMGSDGRRAISPFGRLAISPARGLAGVANESGAGTGGVIAASAVGRPAPEPVITSSRFDCAKLPARITDPQNSATCRKGVRTKPS